MRARLASSCVVGQAGDRAPGCAHGCSTPTGALRPRVPGAVAVVPGARPLACAQEAPRACGPSVRNHWNTHRVRLAPLDEHLRTARRHPRRGLAARYTLEDVPGVAKTALLHAREVGVTRRRLGERLLATSWGRENISVCHSGYSVFAISGMGAGLPGQDLLSPRRGSRDLSDLCERCPGKRRSPLLPGQAADHQELRRYGLPPMPRRRRVPSSTSWPVPADKRPEGRVPKADSQAPYTTKASSIKRVRHRPRGEPLGRGFHLNVFASPVVRTGTGEHGTRARQRFRIA